MHFRAQDYTESKHHEQSPNILGFGLLIYYKLSAYIDIFLGTLSIVI